MQFTVAQANQAAASSQAHLVTGHSDQLESTAAGRQVLLTILRSIGLALCASQLDSSESYMCSTAVCAHKRNTHPPNPAVQGNVKECQQP